MGQSLIHRNVLLLDLVKRNSATCKPMEEIVKARPLLTSALLMFVQIPAPQAQVTVDITKITCEQLAMQQLPWNSGDVMLWLNGYYHGERHNTNVEAEAIKRSENKLSQYCLLHGEMTVMDAVKQINGSDK
jgi:ectoine hydroxylase-related dioxygenase (phytanoyl-CoA dioxygenase family)